MTTLRDRYKAIRDQELAEERARQEELNARAAIVFAENPDIGVEQRSIGPAYDGDTANGERSRYIDTPELRGGDGSSMPQSIEARDAYNELLATGKYTRVDSGKVGRHGRKIIENVAEDGTSIEQELVRRGLASIGNFEGAPQQFTQAIAQALYNA